MAARYTYSKKELQVYFDRICLPDSKRIYSVEGLSEDDKLAFLQLLQKHQLVKIPWENLTLHYSWHHQIAIKPPHLFKKISRSQGRGGYCFEVNLFFFTILLSLGYQVYSCGSRIYNPSTTRYGGFTHLVNLVTIAGTKYLCDGGYGGSGPSTPMPLVHGNVQEQVEPAQMRLLFAPIRQNLTDHKVWIFQHRFDQESDWRTCYCFPDLEFTQEDIEGMHLIPSTSRSSFFTHRIVAVRFTTTLERNGTKGPGTPYEREMSGEIDGAIILNHDVLKWRRRGKKVIEWPLHSEADRLEALGMYFGISLSEEDVEGIRGTAAALGPRAMDDP